MDDSLLKIGEIAAFYHVSPKALRLYEKMGIIVPERVDAGTGYRYYTADQVHQIKSLLELQALGFSLAEIKGILKGGATGAQFCEALARKRIAWQESVALAENKMAAIDGILERMASSKPAVKMQEMTDEQRAWLLVKMVCVEDIRGQAVLGEAIWL